jgi:hypothetical protein
VHYKQHNGMAFFKITDAPLFRMPELVSLSQINGSRLSFKKYVSFVSQGLKTKHHESQLRNESTYCEQTTYAKRRPYTSMAAYFPSKAIHMDECCHGFATLRLSLSLSLSLSLYTASSSHS